MTGCMESVQYYCLLGQTVVSMHRDAYASTRMPLVDVVAGAHVAFLLAVNTVGYGSCLAVLSQRRWARGQGSVSWLPDRPCRSLLSASSRSLQGTAVPYHCVAGIERTALLTSSGCIAVQCKVSHPAHPASCKKCEANMQRCGESQARASC